MCYVTGLTISMFQGCECVVTGLTISMFQGCECVMSLG